MSWDLTDSMRTSKSMRLPLATTRQYEGGSPFDDDDEEEEVVVIMTSDDDEDVGRLEDEVDDLLDAPRGRGDHRGGAAIACHGLHAGDDAVEAPLRRVSPRRAGEEGREEGSREESRKEGSQEGRRKEGTCKEGREEGSAKKAAKKAARRPRRRPRRKRRRRPQRKRH